MNLAGILHNFKVEVFSSETLVLKWIWDQPLVNIIYFQISYSYSIPHALTNTSISSQNRNPSPRIFYSPFILMPTKPQYTLSNLLPSTNYRICLRIFLKNSASFTKKTSDALVNSQIPIQNVPVQNHPQVCTIIKTEDSTSLISSALLFCLIGSAVAFLLLLLAFIIHRFHRYRLKYKQQLSFKKSVGLGTNNLDNGYYERHRNSNTSLHDVDECEMSCTSQMICDALNWSQSVNSSSGIYTPISSPSGNTTILSPGICNTPKIVEEDNFYNAFVDKVSDDIAQEEKPDIIMNNVYDSYIQRNLEDKSIINQPSNIPSPIFRNMSSSTLASSSYNPTNDNKNNNNSIVTEKEFITNNKNNNMHSNNISITSSPSRSTVVSIDYSNNAAHTSLSSSKNQHQALLSYNNKKINSSTISSLSSTDLPFPMSVISDSSVSNDLFLQLVDQV